MIALSLQFSLIILFTTVTKLSPLNLNCCISSHTTAFLHSPLFSSHAMQVSCSSPPLSHTSFCPYLPISFTPVVSSPPRSSETRDRNASTALTQPRDATPPARSCTAGGIRKSCTSRRVGAGRATNRILQHDQEIVSGLSRCGSSPDAMDAHSTGSHAGRT